MPSAGGAIQPGRLGHEGTADRKTIQKVALPTRNLTNISALFRVFFGSSSTPSSSPPTQEEGQRWRLAVHFYLRLHAAQPT